jgi:hypothetical protein
MTLAFDTLGPGSSGQNATAPTSVTWAHTCSGVQRVLIVFVAVGQGSGSDATKTISGVTYAGVAMTQIGTPRHSNDQTAGYLACYGLINPATGANNVVVSFASAPSTAECGSLSFTGADQTTAWGTPVTGAGTGTTATVAVASNTNGNIIAYGVVNGAPVLSATSPATSRYLSSYDQSSAGGNTAGATIPATGSSVTCAWSVSSDWWGLIAVEVKAAAAAVPFQGWGIPA